MSLWTPYVTPAVDEPLDLSTDLSKVKQELPESTEAINTPDAVRPTLNDYCNYPSQMPQMPMASYPYMYPTAPYPYPYAAAPVSSVQISPVSVGSSRSGCELGSPPQAVPVCGPPASSPSESLTSQPLLTSEAELSDDPDFQEFERSAMRAMAERNGGTLLGHNPRMRRVVQSTQAVDDSYRKQRERNNLAAKQSRDRRKLREVHLALKVTYLKSLLDKLKTQALCVNCSNSTLHRY